MRDMESQKTVEVNREEKQQENGRGSEEKRREKKTAMVVTGEQWPECAVPTPEVVVLLNDEAIANAQGKEKEKKHSLTDVLR